MVLKAVSLIGVLFGTIAISLMLPPENSHMVGLFGAVAAGYCVFCRK